MEKVIRFASRQTRYGNLIFIECYFLNTAAQARRWVEAVGLPGVGVLYDTHHAQIEE